MAIRPPFVNPDFEYDEDDFEYDDRPSGVSREMLALFMQDMMNKESGKVAPDTTGAYYFFLDEFVTRDMEYDFALIEQDFIQHCSGKLQEFNEAGWYGEDERWTAAPKVALQKKMLRLMYNGAKLGDRYCVELIRYLYKLYHKKEYNQLKRFSTISTSEIFALSEDEWGGNNYGAMGRILGMCQFMNIKQDDSCSILYLLLDKTRKEWISDNEEEREFLDFEDGLFEECVQQVELWIKDHDHGDFRDFRKATKVYHEHDEFVEACLRHLGYPSDYVFLCMDNNMGLRVQMARTLAVLKTANPKKDYTFEEVQKYTAIYSTVAALTDVADDFDYELGYLTGDPVDDFEKEDMLFKPENIQYKEEAEKKHSVQKPIINVAPVSNGEASTEDYLKEIAELRRKVNERELENKNLRELYRQAKKQYDEADRMNKKYESERDELIALRNFVYKSELDEEEVLEDSLESMKKVIASKDVVIIGGHINWINKLKQQFPNWMFIHPDTYKNVDGKMLDDKDYVYFFTDYMNHISYTKFIAAVRERKIPFGYLGSRNVESLVKQIYEDLCK